MTNDKGCKMKNKELLPCPFCGGEAEVLDYPEVKAYCVACLECGVETLIYSSKEKVIKNWNTRTNKIPVGNGKDYTVVNE